MPESLPSSALVGSTSARAIRRRTAAADCVLVGGTEPTDGPGAEATDARQATHSGQATHAPRAGIDPPSQPDAEQAAQPEAEQSDIGPVLAEVCRPARVNHAAGLERLAEIAAAGAEPLVLADADLRISLPATLDLLDVPGDPTGALLADPRNIEAPRQAWHGLDQATLARTGPDGVIISAGTADGRYTVTGPNRVVVGLLRIAAADRPRVATAWRQAAELIKESPAADNLFDLALLALVRAGIRIGEVTIGYYDWSRRGFGADGLGRSPWRQRLRSASRLGDGAYSTAVVRPLSRLGTRLALAVDLGPNPITMISIVIGLLAGVLILTGSPAGWIAAAVLVQLALVIDCMDGEVARFTRRFSTVGAWLDGIGDRFKEYLILATVAAIAVRQGESGGWLLAIIAMVLITARHLEDYAYSDRSAAERVSVVRPRAITEPGDGGRALRSTLPPAAGRQAKIIFWLKKIVHAPVAERTLIISLTLLTLQPRVVLLASIVVSAIALSWTCGGRFLRALRRPVPQGGAELGRQLDLSRIAAPLVRRTVAEPGRLSWLLLPMIFVGESAVIAAVGLSALPPEQGLLAFLPVAAVVYRRYELIYGIRLFTADGPAPLLGADGRIVLTLLIGLAGLLTGPTVLIGGLIILTVITVLEGAAGTAVRRRRAAAQT